MDYLKKYIDTLSANIVYGFQDFKEYLESLDYKNVRVFDRQKFFVFDPQLRSSQSFSSFIKSDKTNKKYPLSYDFKSTWEYHKRYPETSLEFVEGLFVTVFITFFVAKDNPNAFSIKDMKEEVKASMSRFNLLNEELDVKLNLINYEFINTSSTRTKTFRLEFVLVPDNYFEITTFQVSPKEL